MLTFQFPVGTLLAELDLAVPVFLIVDVTTFVVVRFFVTVVFELGFGVAVDVLVMVFLAEAFPFVPRTVHPDTQPSPQCSALFPQYPEDEQQVPEYIGLPGAHKVLPCLGPQVPSMEYG